ADDLVGGVFPTVQIGQSLELVGLESGRISMWAGYLVPQAVILDKIIFSLWPGTFVKFAYGRRIDPL
ncbi:MAG: hypothetical protein KKC37_04220, partial [Proteobacteria bacterium]|nr:hypothetical protein [Pseudomonadota bacterium]